MHYGLIVAEIKTVGDNFASLTKTEAEQDDTVKDRVKRGIKQLNKDCEVLRYLVSDPMLKHQPRIRKIFMLPNISRNQLQRVLNNNQQVRQELSECLDAQAFSDVADLCLTADEVTDPNNPSDVTEEVLERLSGWWRRAVTAPFESEHADLVARFAGPATTVSVYSVTEPPQLFRSLGEGVRETSHRFTRDIILLPHQLDVLNRNEPMVCLCGPPGTGKSLMLAVMARDWMCRGWDVHVVGLADRGLAASYMIVHQLQQMDQRSQQAAHQQQQVGAGHTVQRVHHHSFDFRDNNFLPLIQAAVNCLVGEAAKTPGPFCVVVDEAFHIAFGMWRITFHTRATGRGFTSWRRPFSAFCTELHQRLPGLRVWAASLHSGKTPSCMTEIHMTEPLRTPPLVTKEVRLAYHINQTKDVLDYTFGPTPLPSEGPVPRVLYHAGEGHSEGSPDNCEKCGHNVATVLKELHVALAGQVASTAATPASSTATTASASGTTTASASGTATASASGNATASRTANAPTARTATVPASGTTTAPTSRTATAPASGTAVASASCTTTATIPAPLAYRDVFLLTSRNNQVLYDDERDDAGNIVKPASGVVRGLRKAGVPVKVLNCGDAAAIRDVAVMAGPDQLVAASTDSVCGLERAVVIWVETQRSRRMGDELYGRLLAMSRTTSQLVRLAWPLDPTAPSTSTQDDTATPTAIPLPPPTATSTTQTETEPY